MRPAILLATFLALGFQTASAQRQNVVFLLVDDLGWADLGCYGSTFHETPHIDAFAASGMRFTDAYAAAPVCSPTRAAIMAGKYPARMNTTEWFGGRRAGKLLPATYVDRLPLEEVTMAEAFRDAGYRTGFVGKWHLGPRGFFPEDQGFDVNIAGHARGHPASYFFPYRNRRYGVPGLHGGKPGEYLTDRLTDAAIRFVDDHRARPFLLFLSYYTVHTPLQGRPDLVRHFRAKRARRSSPRRRFVPEGKRRDRIVQDHAVYAAMVASLDARVGRLLRRLSDLGLDENTIVVLTSDNGGLSTSEGRPTSNRPLRAGKGWLYEGGIREPLIVRMPGVTRPGSTCSVPVTSPDFYPTLLEATELPLRPKQHVDGTSLMASLRGAESLEREAVYWHYPHYSNQGGFPGSAIRAGNLKLIENLEDKTVALYDLAKDVGERNDLSSTRRSDVRRLRTRLASWREDVEARMLRRR